MVFPNGLRIALAIICMSVGIAATELQQFDSEELRARYDALSYQFRCPKCQNQNVAGSNAPIAVDIRQKTYEMLHQGYSDEDIIDFMVERYTEFVIYKPRMSWITIWLWVLPALVLCLGVFVVWRMSHRSPAATHNEPLTAEEQARVDALMKESD